MQEQNFEKQVRQKMEELSFAPSEPVWQKVEEQIRKKKDKRRFVYWFIPFAVLGGAIFFWFMSETPVKQQGANTSVVNGQQQNEPVKKTTTTSESTSPITQAPPVSKTKESSGNTIAATSKESDMVIGRNHSKNSKPLLLPQKKHQRAAKQAPETAGPPLVAMHEGPADLNTKGERQQADMSTGNNASAIVSADKQPDNPVAGDVSVTATPDQQSTHSNNDTATASEDSIQSVAPTKDTLAATTDSGVVSNKKLPRKWNISLHASGGLSNISKGFNALKSVFSTEAKSASSGFYAADRSPLQNSSNLSFNNGSLVSLPPSPVYRNYSVSLGFDLENPISERWSIVTGLQYNYFSTWQYTGRRVDNAGAILQRDPNARIEAYYLNNTGSPQSRYTTHYHFVSLPLGVEYKLLKKLPLFAQMGVEISRLLSTNALYYDQHTFLYYHDKSLYRKTQLLGTASFSYQVLSTRKGFLYAGPQLQYGFTNLLKERTHGEQHLISIGINTHFAF